ncbi:hypothetical protein EIY71_18885 [Pseudomonas sp. CH235]|nr:hypothetical protein EIY71_18885 [Pseudomonas sp. CH235]
MGGEGCHCFSLDRDSESLDTLCNSPVPHWITSQTRSLIVPTLRVGMPPWTLCVQCDAERHGMHSHAERGNDQYPVQ